MGRSGNIEIFWVNTEQKIADTSSDQVTREASLLKRFHDPVSVIINPIGVKVGSVNLQVSGPRAFNRTDLALANGSSGNLYSCLMPMSLFSDRFLIRFNGDFTFESLDPVPCPGPLVVLLHGVMGSHSNFRTIAKRLSQQLPADTMTYDARGHGQSEHFDLAADPGGFTPTGMAEDLCRILNALALKAEAAGQIDRAAQLRAPIDVVGHSMGGRVAYHFARLYPDRVRRLVIEDIGPVPPALKTENQRHLVERILDEIPVPFTDIDAAKAWFQSEFTRSFGEAGNTQVLAAWLQTNLIQTSKGVTWRFQIEGIRSVVRHGRTEKDWPDWPDLSMPVLLVRGERSNDLPKSVFDELLRTQPKAIGLEVGQAGHWVHSEQPHLFLSKVCEFLVQDRF